MSQAIASVLADRDTNAQITPNAPDLTGAETIQEEPHKSVSGLNGKVNGSYVSPSDAILSPASQKLTHFKQRQINKQNNNKNPTARSLFSHTASSVSSGGKLEEADDVNKPQE